ncbi:putative F-box/FBD/LRR-repeat protein at5g44950 [Phtheirospermum japonicum]|uniref:Putative F-box/FBD/LRR-repeat protein at5g44950 n=1 Tax=Phtheirospermum japonicum TaxID=374723 RepID=A0A830CZK4_9LAMI|nr:putative F-box/FBD/LRR-repeat protein at5g44950 [Phtheirospermum japonicum]
MFLWTHVPNLDFNTEDYDTSGTTFSDIVNKVILLHKGQNINTFRLDHELEFSDFEFEAWIDSLVARNVRTLEITLQERLLLPPCLFTSFKALVDLTLRYCGGLLSEGTVFLPALKKLRLDRITYEDDASLPHLLSGCPVLEELLIERGSLERTVACCYIPSPTLNKFVLISEYKNDIDDEVFRVKLDTPALRYLKLYDSVSEDISAAALTSLIEADVSFKCKEPNLEDYVLYYQNVIEFVAGFYNVKCLKLSTLPMAQVPDSAFSALTIKFDNLTELELAGDYRFIQSFLENADNLEILTIHIDCDDLNWMEPTQVPSCMVSHLQTVRIHQLDCVEQELSMANYILRNAKVLKRMDIYSLDCVDKLETLKRISLLERGSEACQLVLH